MLKKLIKATSVAAKVTAAVVFVDDDDSDDVAQLDTLSDGFGGVIADGESMTQQEAEQAQSRGELHNTFL